MVIRWLSLVWVASRRHYLLRYNHWSLYFVKRRVVSTWSFIGVRTYSARSSQIKGLFRKWSTSETVLTIPDKSWSHHSWGTVNEWSLILVNKTTWIICLRCLKSIQLSLDIIDRLFEWRQLINWRCFWRWICSFRQRYLSITLFEILWLWWVNNFLNDLFAIQ